MNANWMIVKAMQSEDLFWFMEKVLVILFQILGLGWYEAISSSQGRCLPKFAPFLEKKRNQFQTCANNDILAHLGGPLSSSKIFVNFKPLLVFKNSQNYRWNLDHRRIKTSWKAKKWQKIGEDWVHCLVAEADNTASNIFSLTFWEFTFMQMFY